jgi:hypothetical protein
MYAVSADLRAVAGFCPACGGRSLCLGAGGYVTCSRVDCPRPCAAADLLDDPETEHIVQLDPDVFTVRHPLRERLDDALMSCGLHAHIAGLDGPPRQCGRYRVRAGGDGWSWERLGTEESGG